MPALPLNAVIGKYRIEKLVGSGGMGEVYLATDLQRRMPVAVKALIQGGESDAALARFRNEAVIQYNLRHPHVAELYECFEYRGNPCIAMEFVEGRTLDEWIRETGSLAPENALEVLAEVCDAVSYMHAKGTIHRDIKSQNIRVNAQGRAKLLDFGISVSKETPVFTRAGYAIGTPEKMAPEQHQGVRGDARSDVWSLGVLLYEMVTGTPPFANSNPSGLREDILAVRYIPAGVRKPGLPKSIIRMIATCLRAKPDERYASSGVLLREVHQLRRQLANHKRTRSFRVPALLAAGLTALALALLFYASRPASGVPNISKEKNASADASPSNAAPAPVGAAVEAGAPRARPAVVTDTELPQVHSGPGLSSTPGLPTSVPTAEANTLREPETGEQKTIRVATYDGPADVKTKDGRILGSTPYPLTGSRGMSYELWLSRPGFQPRKVDVEINNKNEYLFGLEKMESQTDLGKKE
jgi:eukaryotic-like serine/threonine-protein kinase